MRLVSVIFTFGFALIAHSALACSPIDDSEQRLNAQIIGIEKSGARAFTLKFYVENRFSFDLCRVVEAPLGGYASNRYLSLTPINQRAQIPARLPRHTVAEALFRFEYPEDFVQIPAPSIPLDTNLIYQAGTDISNSCAPNEPLITTDEARLDKGEIVELGVGLIATYRPCEADIRIQGSLAGSLSRQKHTGEYYASPGLSIRAKVTPEFELIAPK